MGRKINAKTDRDILVDIGLGIRYKDIAAKHGVSPSYVSKLSTGKKKPALDIPIPQTFQEDDILAYIDDVDAVVKLIDKRPVMVNKRDIVSFLEGQIQKSVIRIKLYNELLKIIKENNQ